MHTVECIYCGAEVEDVPTPGHYDDEAWEEAAKEHITTCEWVLTRAHTQPYPEPEQSAVR